MSDRKVSKANTRFKKGVSGNPKGRPRRRPPEVGAVMKGIMDGSVEYREDGRTRKATRRELSVKRHLKRAVEGDIGAAEALLQLRAQAQKKRGTSGSIVQICDLLPVDPSRSGGRKVGEASTHDQTEMPASDNSSDDDPADGAP